MDQDLEKGGLQVAALLTQEAWRGVTSRCQRMHQETKAKRFLPPLQQIDESFGWTSPFRREIGRKGNNYHAAGTVRPAAAWLLTLNSGYGSSTSTDFLHTSHLSASYLAAMLNQTRSRRARWCHQLHLLWNYRHWPLWALGIILGLFTLRSVIVSLMASACKPSPLGEHPVRYQADTHMLQKVLQSYRSSPIDAQSHLTSPDQVAILILTSGDASTAQSEAVRRSWGGAAANMGYKVRFITSDGSVSLESSTTQKYRQSVEALPDTWRIWSHAVQEFPKASFFVMCNESTYLRPNVLWHFVQSLRIGTKDAFGDNPFGYLHLGAGQIFSRESVTSMIEGYHKGLCPSTIYHDLTVSQCAEKTGTRLVAHPMMHQYPPHEFWGCAAESLFRIYGGPRLYEVADLHDMWMTFHNIDTTYMLQIHRFLEGYPLGSSCLIGGLSALAICIRSGYIEDEVDWVKYILIRLMFLGVVVGMFACRGRLSHSSFRRLLPSAIRRKSYTLPRHDHIA